MSAETHSTAQRKELEKELELDRAFAAAGPGHQRLVAVFRAQAKEAGGRVSKYADMVHSVGPATNTPMKRLGGNPEHIVPSTLVIKFAPFIGTTAFAHFDADGPTLEVKYMALDGKTVVTFQHSMECRTLLGQASCCGFYDTLAPDQRVKTHRLSFFQTLNSKDKQRAWLQDYKEGRVSLRGPYNN